MILRTGALILVAACGSMVVSCGSGRFVPEKPPAQPLNQYAKVVVEPFSVSLEKPAGEVEKKRAEVMAALITARVHERLAEKGLFAGEGRTLRVQGEIVLFDPGSQFLRWFIGFCAGSGEIVARVVLTEGERETVARGNARGTVIGGFMGGTIDDAAKRLADALVGFIEDNHEQLEAANP